MYLRKNTVRILLSVALFTLACSTKNDAVPDLSQEVADNPSLPFDQRLKQFVEHRLHTHPDETYRLKVYREHLVNTDEKDVVVTVNRWDHALKVAQANKQVRQASAVGFFGEHNYIIFYNSKTDKFSEPIVVASSPQRELDISFENISSSQRKDMIVDYCIRNSQFRKIFLFLHNTPTYAFQWKRYDGWGTDQLEAYCFDFLPSTNNPKVKDIAIYQGEMNNIDKETDYYTIQPKINCTQKLVKQFFYNPSDRKYYTNNLD